MGVALGLSIAWGATIRKVEVLARGGGGSLPSPPPSPSKQRGVPPVKLFTPQESLLVSGGGGGGGGLDGAEGVRRRAVGGVEIDTSSSATSAPAGKEHGVVRANGSSSSRSTSNASISSSSHRKDL